MLNNDETTIHSITYQRHRVHVHYCKSWEKPMFYTKQS